MTTSELTSDPPSQSNTRLRTYNQSIIKPVGAATLKCTVNGIRKKIHFEVVRDAPTSLLSGKASEALKLIQFKQDCLVNTISEISVTSLTKDEVLTEYRDVFGGLGRLPGHYHIDMDPDVKPVQNTGRRVPLPVKAEVKAKLQDLEQSGVLTKVIEPTPWISNMVAVRKPNKLRICLDPLHLNKGIKQKHHPIPTVEDVAPRLTKARIFSTVDAKDGFLQVVLDEPSSMLTTFWTPYGRYRWLRMPFGISSAPEEFQRRLEECLEGLANVEVIADDIVIYGAGNTEAEAQVSHDAAFRALLERCRERGLRLNGKKLKFKLDSVAYMGHILSAQGLSPDPDKVRAVVAMPPPTDVQGVQRLIGVFTYLSKFMPRLSTVCEPLRRLTDKDGEFDWMPQHDKALSTIKALITQAPVLHFYDVNKDVTIECDSSDVGLGAVLMQDLHLTAYASRALTPTERNYAQIEKECLAIVYATERFEQYILGKEEVVVESDHKPLSTIFKKPILTSPKCLQRMRLRLQKFSLVIQYKPGPQMCISDTLSRAALPIQEVNSSTPNYQIFQLDEEQRQREDIANVHSTARRAHTTAGQMERRNRCQNCERLDKEGKVGWRRCVESHTRMAKHDNTWNEYISDTETHVSAD